MDPWSERALKYVATNNCVFLTKSQLELVAVILIHYYLPVEIFYFWMKCEKAHVFPWTTEKGFFVGNL